MNPINVLSAVVSFWWVIPILLLLVLHRLVLRIFGVVMVPQDAVGIVNKKYCVVGKNRSLPNGALVALEGQAGLQGDTLAPGVHFWLLPWQFEVSLQPFITVKEGSIGVIEARDGQPMPAGRVLARHIDCNSFQDARAFLKNGGERGPQISIVAPGTYRINTALFSVRMEEAVEIDDNKVGIVTTMEGQPLSTGDIAGPEIEGHNSFQDGQVFINNGGRKGLQEQVLLAGRYYINPMFVEVEQLEMSTVPIAHVGVVIAYVGEKGTDVTGETFKHGNLVPRGKRGVWVEPLDPGKYPLNLYTHKIENVPTANVVLNWASGKTESHKLDEKLSTIKVRSADGFGYNMDVSQIIHIPGPDAPKVIARFGTVQNLVSQVLEPTIGNYFRNAAQGSDVIGFLSERKQRQDDAKAQIAKALQEYNVNAVDTLIGDIVPPEALMKTLTDRKIATQEKQTFTVQKEAEETRKELQQARATAETQASVVSAQRSVEIAEFNASAAVKTADGARRAAVLSAQGQAESNLATATAQAQATMMLGEADGKATLARGSAEAEVVKRKIDSMEAGNFAGIEIAKALAGAGVPLVPGIVATGGGPDGGGGGLVSLLLANLVKQQQQSNGQEVARPHKIA